MVFCIGAQHRALNKLKRAVAGCTAEAIALEVGSEVALVLQQFFGVCSLLVVVGTLIALTPVGARLFNDGKVQPFPPAEVKSSSGDTVPNPLAPEPSSKESEVFELEIKK